MPLPDRQTIKCVLLNILEDGEVRRSDEIERRLISYFGLAPKDLAEVTKAGRTKFGNEIDWAKVELQQEDLLSKAASKHYQITQKGLAALEHDWPPVDIEQADDLGSDFEKETELHKALRSNIERLEAG